MRDVQLCHALSANIRIRRFVAGMTQKELSKLAGVACGSISAYENGLKTPPVDVAAHIAKALGTTLEKMFSAPVINCPRCGWEIDFESMFPECKEHQEVTET